MSGELVIILHATHHTAANTVIHGPGTGGAVAEKKKKKVMKACKSKCIAASQATVRTVMVSEQ